MKLSLCIKFTFYVVSSIVLLTPLVVPAEKLEVTPGSKQAVASPQQQENFPRPAQADSKGSFAPIDKTSSSDGKPEIEMPIKGEVSIGIPINSGFVFIDGKYIDAPYHITIKEISSNKIGDTSGGILYINGVRVLSALTTIKSQYNEDIDPELPLSINKNTSLYDKSLTNYLLQKMAYIKKHYNRGEERKIMENVYRSLPCIKEAHITETGALAITTYRGEDSNIGLVGFSRKPLSPRELYKNIEYSANSFINNLKAGGCMMFQANGNRLLIGDPRAAISIIKILNSEKNPAKRFKGLHNAGFNIIDESKKIITDFSGSPQLDQRLENLTSKDDIQSPQ